MKNQMQPWLQKATPKWVNQRAIRGGDRAHAHDTTHAQLAEVQIGQRPNMTGDALAHRQEDGTIALIGTAGAPGVNREPHLGTIIKTNANKTETGADGTHQVNMRKQVDPNQQMKKPKVLALAKRAKHLQNRIKTMLGILHLRQKRKPMETRVINNQLT